MAFFFEDKEAAKLFADIFLRARKKNALRGVMRDESVNCRNIGLSSAARPHDFFSKVARRILASASASRTDSGAVPPGTLWRASEASSVSTAEKSAPNAEEYFFNFSTGQVEKFSPLLSASRTTLPMISCASRKGMPFATR